MNESMHGSAILVSPEPYIRSSAERSGDEAKGVAMRESACRSTARTASKSFRPRAGMFCVALLLLSFLFGATAMSDATANYLDLMKIIAVVCFVGSMIALALGMVGSSYRA